MVNGERRERELIQYFWLLREKRHFHPPLYPLPMNASGQLQRKGPRFFSLTNPCQHKRGGCTQPRPHQNLSSWATGQAGASGIETGTAAESLQFVSKANSISCSHILGSWSFWTVLACTMDVKVTRKAVVKSTKAKAIAPQTISTWCSEESISFFSGSHGAGFHAKMIYKVMGFLLFLMLPFCLLK